MLFALVLLYSSERVTLHTPSHSQYRTTQDIVWTGRNLIWNCLSSHKNVYLGAGHIWTCFYVWSKGSDFFPEALDIAKLHGVEQSIFTVSPSGKYLAVGEAKDSFDLQVVTWEKIWLVRIFHTSGRYLAISHSTGQHSSGFEHLFVNNSCCVL